MKQSTSKPRIVSKAQAAQDVFPFVSQPDTSCRYCAYWPMPSCPLRTCWVKSPNPTRPNGRCGVYLADGTAALILFAPRRYERCGAADLCGPWFGLYAVGALRARLMPRRPGVSPRVFASGAGVRLGATHGQLPDVAARGVGRAASPPTIWRSRCTGWATFMRSIWTRQTPPLCAPRSTRCCKRWRWPTRRRSSSNRLALATVPVHPPPQGQVRRKQRGASECARAQARVEIVPPAKCAWLRPRTQKWTCPAWCKSARWT